MSAYSLYMKLTKVFRGHYLLRFSALLALHNFFKKLLLKNFVITIHGNKMFLDSTDEAMCPRLSQQKVWEPDTTKLVEKLLKKDDVVLDIGANIGYYTLIFARLAKEVFAVEPDPYTFKLLKKNVASNNYKNVELFQAAVTNYTGNCKLYLSNKNRSNNRIYDANENSRVLTVPTIKLDDYFKGKIDFIKIDVEGAEGMVMSGALNILQKMTSLAY